ncbi:MAG TPA: hypothetical protein VEI05_00620 [Burkholderiaceae bacterium]|nr:hypothetical protein [Burkholderiaceae bacterium]
MKVGLGRFASIVSGIVFLFGFACGSASALAHAGAGGGGGLGGGSGFGASGGGGHGGGFGTGSAHASDGGGNHGGNWGGHGRGGGGANGHYHHGYGCCGWGIGGVDVVDPFWDSYLWLDYGYGDPNDVPYGTDLTPPIPGANIPPAPTYWYYCPDARAYYPFVRSCASPWQQIYAAPAH